MIWHVECKYLDEGVPICNPNRVGKPTAVEKEHQKTMISVGRAPDSPQVEFTSRNRVRLLSLLALRQQFSYPKETYIATGH